MRTLKILTVKDEKLLNQLLKRKKTSDYILLYHSEWDGGSNKVLNLAKEWATRAGDETCHVVSSWELPHAFAAFSITTAPTVVEVKGGSVKVHVEYPKVHAFFTPTPPKRKKQRKGPRNRVVRAKA